jgi:hypothetical protein
MKQQQISWRASILRLIHFFTILSMILALIGTAPAAALAAAVPTESEQDRGVALSMPPTAETLATATPVVTGTVSSEATASAPVDQTAATEQVDASQTITVTQGGGEATPMPPTGETPAAPAQNGPGIASVGTIDASQAVTATLDTPLGSLMLEAPPEVRPGEGVRMAWSVGKELPAGTVELQIIAPEGFSWLGEKGKFDLQTRLLILPLQGTSGELTWLIDEKAVGPFTLEASLVVDGKSVAGSKLTLADEGLVLLDAKGGAPAGRGKPPAVFVQRGAFRDHGDRAGEQSGVEELCPAADDRGTVRHERIEGQRTLATIELL